MNYTENCSGIEILSDNLSGRTSYVTYLPDTGGTINLGVQIIPFNYLTNYYYGTYEIYVPTYNYTYSLIVPNPNIPTPTPTISVTPTITPTISLTPSITPTNTVTPTVTPTFNPSPTQTPTPTETPTNTPTLTTTPTVTPTLTPTPTATPASIYNAYLFIEPVTGSEMIGQWMYDGGSNFFGFTNESQPSQNQSTFEFDMNVYVDFPGWTSGDFPIPIQQVIPQQSGGVDQYNNPVVAYNFTTTKVNADTTIGQSWYTWIIPTILTNNDVQTEIDFNTTGNPNLLTPVRTEPTIYQYTFDYTGSTITNTTYRVYTTYPNNLFKIYNNQDIYFRGNSVGQ
jgi:hypothetical protein